MGDEQRANKRRMSILAKERINNLDGQFGNRNKGKNMNTASAMMMGKRPRSNHTGKKTKTSKSKTAKTAKNGGTALLPKNEIAKANKERKSSSKKRKSKKNGDSALSATPSSSKKKKKKSSKKTRI